MPLVIEAPKSITRLIAGIHRNLNIVFFGTPSFAVPTLRLLHDEKWPITAVITAPDTPVGRHRIMKSSPVRSVADELNIPVYTPGTLRDGSFFPTFDALRPDLCIVVAYGKLIPETYLSIPRLGFLNIHPSLLPAYRGPSPIQSAILDGCASTGVSIIQLDSDMDHGPILAAVPWVIPSGFDATLCESELSRIGARLMADTLPGYLDGIVVPMPQNHHQATFCRKFTRNDGRIDWSLPSDAIVNRIRALGANPGTWTTWEGRILNIFHASIIPDPPRTSSPPGMVIREGRELLVMTGDGAVRIEELQLESGKRLPAKEFLNGHSALADAILGT